MPTRKQQSNFADFIQYQLKPSEELMQSVIDWIGDELEPEEVFAENKLEDWATANGYIKE